jgi:hypothetical protein
MVGGRAVATWRLVRKRVAIEPLGRIGRDARGMLEEDAADVERFFSSTRSPA